MQGEGRSVALVRASLGVALVCAAGVQWRFGAAVFQVLARPQAAGVLPCTPPLFSPLLKRIAPEGERAGLRDGDELRVLAGVPIRGRDALAEALQGRHPGEELPALVARQGVPRSLVLPLVPRFSKPLRPAHWALALALDGAMPAFCLLLGFGVALRRPRDPRAYLLLWLMLSFSRIGDSGTATLLDLRGGGIAFYDALLGRSWSLGMFVFGLLFPERLELDRRRPAAKWLLVAPLAVLTLAHALQASLSAGSYALAAPLDRALAALGSVPMFAAMLAIGLFFASVGFKWGTAASPDARRRLRLLLAGSAVSLTPPFLVVLTALLAGDGLGALPTWAIALALLCLGLFPVTLAYVIVVERAMDLRVVIRQGLQYAFARNGIVALRVGVSFLLVLGAVTLASDPNRNRPRKILPLAVGFLFVVIVGRLADRLHAWTDRRFFREAYDAERILGELSERVRTIVEREPLLETVTRAISESLHVPRVSALLPSPAGLKLAQAEATTPGPGAVLEAEGPLVERLRQGDAVRVYLEGAGTGRRHDPVLESERPALEALGAELLLPLSVKGDLLGVLCLGPKRSEEPYSHSDVRLLRSLAAQTSLALENSRLTEAVAADAARRERLNRELEIAREVQEQLFPQSVPALPGVDLAGCCRPARGVGGDYYDFLVLAGGRAGIAIGDVSGKGIPAALLMAALQASLRSQALAAPADLTALMGNLNRLICESSAPNRYATFFYAEYEPGPRRLGYVNAGHNAPMLFRRGGPPGEPLRLERGGPVIGLLDAVPFEQGVVRLEPGDVLVAFTDGISEAMNPAGEEWGEERLAAAVQGCRGRPAREIAARVLQAADAFAAGAEQHDDMTLVVMTLPEPASGSQPA